MKYLFRNMRFFSISTFLMWGCVTACKPWGYMPSEEVNTYVQAFYAEAKSRGVSLVSKKIIIDWGEMEAHQFGKCLPRKKMIFLNEVTWAKMDSLRRRSLIFHELAHCLLSRTVHNDQLLPRGECASLLKSELADCICNVYEKKWWKYYVDELFDEHIKLPDWYEEQEQLEMTYMKSRLIIDTTFIKNLSIDIPDSIHRGKFIGEIEIFQTYQENAACYFGIGWNGITPVQNNKLNIYRAYPYMTQYIYFHSGTYQGKILQHVAIYYDREYWRFYVNGLLVYKMGNDYWEGEMKENAQYLNNFPAEVSAWGKSKISGQSIPLSGRLKIFEIQ